MADWDDAEIVSADTKMANDGVPFHARRFHLGQTLQNGRFANSRTYTDKIADDYRRLFPEYSAVWSGWGAGFINSEDRVRKITPPTFAGTVWLSQHEYSGFDSHEDLMKFCREREDIFCHVTSQSQMVFDIDNLIIDKDKHPKSAALWLKSKSYLNAISDNLQNSYFVGFSNSETWLLFEFAAKSLLSFCGKTDQELRSMNHRKDRLLLGLNEVIDDRSKREALAEIVADLPEYNSSRYDPVELSRVDVIHQAAVAQHGAAICATSFTGQSQESRILPDSLS
jgi:hypothetical protein